MRIPLTVPRNTLKVYAASEFTLNLPSEIGRTIRCEDMSIGGELGPTCSELCLQVLIQAYTKKPGVIKDLDESDQAQVYHSLPTDIPLEQSIELIEDDNYWMRRVLARWSDITQFKEHAGKWRKYYLERHLTEYIQDQNPEYYDIDKISSDSKLLAPFIIDLDITELKARDHPSPPEDDPEAPPIYIADHFPLDSVIKHLPKLETLRVRYGPKHVGDKFTWDLLSMSIEDCRWLGRGILQIPNLRVLCIHRSFLGDDEIQPLLQALSNYAPLEELDFSYCRIGDRGGLMLGKLLSMHPNLKILKLPCNSIGDLGARGIAYGLRQEGSSPLTYLDMRLNPLGEEGTKNLLGGLIRIKKPETLIIAAVGALAEGALRIAESVCLQRSIKVLDITANHLGEEGGEWLYNCVSVNERITNIDCRETGIPEDVVAKINELTKRNLERGEGVPLELVYVQSEEVIPRVFSFSLTPSEIARQDAKDAEYQKKKEEAERQRRLENEILLGEEREEENGEDEGEYWYCFQFVNDQFTMYHDRNCRKKTDHGKISKFKQVLISVQKIAAILSSYYKMYYIRYVFIIVFLFLYVIFFCRFLYYMQYFIVYL